ncbi:MAG: hypothetical protein AAFX05_10825 [Planctomycetota bacterium]
MSGVLGWVKSNLIIVIAMVVAIVGIPVMLYFSNGWMASIMTALQDDVRQTMGKLDQKIQYSIPAIAPGQEAWELRTEPNEKLTNEVASILRRLVEESEAARKEIIAANSEGKMLIVDGEEASDKLFPAPQNESARVRLLTQLMQELPVVHEAMLDDVRAGEPPEPLDVRSQLEAVRARRINEMVGGRADQTLSPDEEAELRSFLGEQRKQIYLDRAQSITMYASPDVFLGLEEWVEGQTPPPLERAWEWQWQYWVHQDIMAALAKANSSVAADWLPVYSAPVKRVLSISVQPHQGEGSSFDAPQDFGGGGGGDAGGDFTRAHTGRSAWPDGSSELYDIRYVDLSVVVDVNRLSKLINSIASTNLMTVIDLDIETIDPQDDLGDGYFYGTDATAIANLRIETIWLREWTKTDMPPQVRTTLGIPEDEPPAGDAQDEG